MIKANELRIGNKVGFYKSTIPEMLIGTVAEIALLDSSSEYHYTIPEFNPKIPVTGKALKRIPLTEDWLLKFGFGEMDLKPHNPDLSIKLCESPISLLTWNRLHNYFYYGIRYGDETNGLKLPRIYYVHQLQNLYFALTGKEITIKQDAAKEAS